MKAPTPMSQELVGGSRQKGAAGLCCIQGRSTGVGNEARKLKHTGDGDRAREAVQGPKTQKDP